MDKENDIHNIVIGLYILNFKFKLNKNMKCFE